MPAPRPLRVQHLVAGVLFGCLREDDFLVESGLDGIDAGAEPKEHPERRQLAFHRGGGEPIFFSPFDAKLVDVTTGEAVEILDTFLFAPLDELLETVVVGLECSVGDFVTP